MCAQVLLEFGGDGGGMFLCEGSQTLHQIINASDSSAVTLEGGARISVKQQPLQICKTSNQMSHSTCSSTFTYLRQLVIEST